MTEVPAHWVSALEEAVGRLNQFVVSMDRIGSSGLSEAERADALRRFIEDWEITPSLSSVRGTLLELLKETVDLGTLDEDEDWLDRLKIPTRPRWNA